MENTVQLFQYYISVVVLGVKFLSVTTVSTDLFKLNPLLTL